MEVTTSFIVVRFVMSALLAAGGIACIVFGYRLFRDGTGIAKAIDKIDWKSEQTKISAAGMSVGSVLMLTSVGWGYFANNSIPKLELAAGNVKITQMPNLNQKIAWASAIGVPVETKDKQLIGTITGVVVGPDWKSSNFVVSGKNAPAVTVETGKFRFNNAGSAVVDYNKGDFETLYRASANPPRPPTSATTGIPNGG